MRKMILPMIVILNLATAACGVKPKSVDAPQGNDNDTFESQTYPSK